MVEEDTKSAFLIKCVFLKEDTKSTILTIFTKRKEETKSAFCWLLSYIKEWNKIVEVPSELIVLCVERQFKHLHYAIFGR
jgi:hypothetical protein